MADNGSMRLEPLEIQALDGTIPSSSNEEPEMLIQLVR